MSLVLKPAAALTTVQIVDCFNATFAASDRVLLTGGFDEPLYLPAAPDRPAQLRFTHDYAASALHEASHWCIAGVERRRRLDFGYSYQPAPRSVSQQQAFLHSEIGAQALESLFADYAGVAFNPSFDDIADAHPELRVEFIAAVERRRRSLQAGGCPPAAQRFCAALSRAVLQQSPVQREH